MESQNLNVRKEKSLVVPLLIVGGIVSIIFSMFINNYFGMGLAAGTIIGAALIRKDLSQTAWNWVLGLSAIGFFLGVTALLMKIFLTTFNA